MNQNEYKKIISLAIEREVGAYTFYRAVSDKAKDKNLKSIFNKLAEDERENIKGRCGKSAKAWEAKE